MWRLFFLKRRHYLQLAHHQAPFAADSDNDDDDAANDVAVAAAAGDDYGGDDCFPYAWTSLAALWAAWCRSESRSWPVWHCLPTCYCRSSQSRSICSDWCSCQWRLSPTRRCQTCKRPAPGPRRRIHSASGKWRDYSRRVLLAAWTPPNSETNSTAACY